MSKRLHIIIAEPSPIIRCGVVTILQSDSTLSCDVAEVSDPSALPNMVQTQQPDLLIANPAHLGFAIPAQLRTGLGGEGMKIIALQSTFFEPTQLQGYDDVISIYDSADVVIRKIVDSLRSDTQEERRKELSAREKEIIVCVVKGMTNKQIADELYLSTHTVIAHRRNISSKLQIHSASGLTIYAIVNGLVDLADING